MFDSMPHDPTSGFWDALGLRARDEHELFFQKHPTLTEREYLEGVFTETGTLPAMREFFDRRHNPLWQCGPSGDAAAALLDFWRRTDPDSGLLVHDFTDPEWNTRFLGDLYQDLSEAARKKYALLQTPEFIEEFILDRTLGPAIDTFGYQIVRMIDPTCGSGHFLLGGFFRMFRLWQRENPGENPRVLAQNALNAIHGVDLNPYAVAIARFRLLLAALQVCGITKLKNAPDFSIHLASGDSLLHGRRFRESEGETRRQSLFETDDDVFRDERMKTGVIGHQSSVIGREPEVGTETPEGSSSPISNLQSPISSFDPAAHGFIAATRPHLVSAQQLAEVVQADPLFLEVAECLEGHSGFSVSALVQRLVEAESVPALPRDRYKDSGLRKREDWEETWRLQRAEDAVEEEVKGLNVEGRKSEEELKKLIRKAQLEKVGEIAVPPKYGSGDFKKASYWKLRGKLDVPKERWISYPGAERDGDTSPVIAWAGWDHLDQAKALAEYFLDAKDAHGWPPAKLKPLLAALADLLPWLKQWHNTFDPNYGMGLGDYFQGFLEEQCRALEMTVEEADKTRFGE